MKSQPLSKLQPLSLLPLPLGAIKPRGWLRDQLRVQADGLTGHLDEFWPDVRDSRWIGGESEGWERGPYWLDGFIPLAFLLDDTQLQSRARHWIDYILEHQHEDGWLGVKNDPHAGEGEEVLDPWPLFVLFKAFIQWHEATGDERIVPAMSRALRRIQQLLNEKPLESWAKMRWPELAFGVLWLYEQTGAAWLLELARLAETQGYDWRAHFQDFAFTGRQNEWTQENHVVNNAMGLKEPAMRYRTDENRDDRAARLAELKQHIAVLDRYHGQASGVFAGDETLSGTDPTQGTETCAVVEYLFSLEQSIAAFGDAELGDRLERIAFNALPAPFTKDMWARQYDQQANQVLVSHAPRIWVSNGDEANLFSLEGNFGCCTANLHQGWPKFATHLWMKTPDNGLAAIAFAPCEITTTLGDAEVTITEATEYPFRDEIRFTVQVSQPVHFPLRLRVPAWAQDATVTIGDEDATAVTAGAFHTIEREWRDGDVVTLKLPMTIRLEQRSTGGTVVLRGPLVFSLKIGEEFRHLKGEAPHADWEVLPTTPWNYGLVAEVEQMEVREAPLSATPFDPQAAPLTLTAPARRVPRWEMEKNSAGPLPASPVETAEPLERVELIPYGSCHLRVTEFPRVKAA